MPVEQADPAPLIAKKHQILAENPKRHRQIAEFGRHRHWLPEAAKVLAARGIGADMGQLGVFSRHMATVVVTIGLADRLFVLASHFHLPRRVPKPGHSQGGRLVKRRGLPQPRRVSVSSTSLRYFVQRERAGHLPV
jgi:cytochrome c oxidase assembly factor CtaG